MDQDASPRGPSSQEGSVLGSLTVAKTSASGGAESPALVASVLLSYLNKGGHPS